MPVTVLDAGLLEYAAALALQQRLCRARQQEQVGDHLLLLEHLPVITLGLSGGREDLRVADGVLQQRGVALFETNRGGRATFHGPGQLVAYPILRLGDDDLHAYLWKLEETLLRLLAQWGIPAQREERYPGVWVCGAGKNGGAGEHSAAAKDSSPQKIAAIGVAVAQGVTMHGLALNVSTDLAFFDLITPCGIQGRGVTSMQRLLGSPPPMPDVKAALVKHFSDVFNLQVINGIISD